MSISSFDRIDSDEKFIALMDSVFPFDRNYEENPIEESDLDAIVAYANIENVVRRILRKAAVATNIPQIATGFFLQTSNCKAVQKTVIASAGFTVICSNLGGNEFMMLLAKMQEVDAEVMSLVVNHPNFNVDSLFNNPSEEAVEEFARIRAWAHEKVRPYAKIIASANTVLRAHARIASEKTPSLPN